MMMEASPGAVGECPWLQDWQALQAPGQATVVIGWYGVQHGPRIRSRQALQ